MNGDFSDWSEELRWLQWRYFPHEELPSSLMAPNLTVLDLGNSDCLIRVWDIKHLESEVESLYLIAIGKWNDFLEEMIEMSTC